MQKSIIRTFAVLASLLCTISTFAHDIEVDGIYYNIITKLKVAEVTYKGTSTSSKAYSGSVIIPESFSYDGTTYSVTSIGRYAFVRCSSLTLSLSLTP